MDKTYQKEVEHFDLNANERLLEIQEELVGLEKRRAVPGVLPDEQAKIIEKIKFLVEEEKLVMDARYQNEKEIKGVENMATRSMASGDKDLKEILQNEIKEEEIIKDELEEIKKATKVRMWYETWWGRLIIIIIGGAILGLLGLEKFISGL